MTSRATASTERLATIGYESDVQPAMIDKLRRAGVEVLIDVRAVAASRRAGFSKRILSASLEEAGIDYVHLRQLGSPKNARTAARKGHTAEMRRIFEDHLAEPASQLALIEAADLAAERKSALLCLEHDAGVCHRAIVAERLHEARGFTIENL